MKANLELDEEQMKIAAEEEKKRRRQLPSSEIRIRANEQTTLWPMFTLLESWLPKLPVLSSKMPAQNR